MSCGGVDKRLQLRDGEGHTERKKRRIEEENGATQAMRTEEKDFSSIARAVKTIKRQYYKIRYD